MAGYFRAVAVDFDGTLTSDGRRPAEEVLAALTRARQSGLLVLLVTGRIVSELRDCFPDVDDFVDLVVAENGCVLSGPALERRLVTAVDPLLAAALAARGVHVRRGEVLLAGRAADRTAVMEEVHRLELECQLVFNRTELMVLPSGVNKGTGLFEALGDVGISRHSTIGVGDAENDHALLDVCEVGVAVANALESLRRSADVSLTTANGRGVAEFLDRLVQSGGEPMHSRRWKVQLGATAAGEPVSVPGSQVNVLVCGGSGSGKSHMAGLFAERLVAQGYCVLVVDPEGDHHALGRLRGVHLVDGRDGLPPPARLVELFSQRFTSVVLDLSTVPMQMRHEFLEQLTVEVDRSRVACGLPHWVISDEAHESATGMHADPLQAGNHAMGRWGSCLVTYRPDLIEPETMSGIDAVIALGERGDMDCGVVDLLAALTETDREAISVALADLGPGMGFLGVRPGLGQSHSFRVGSRLTQHRRHHRKYVRGRLDPLRSFHFRDGQDRAVATAANLDELQKVLRECSDDVVEHHARGGDLSRWVRQVFGDDDLASVMAAAERRLVAGEVSAGQARELLIDAVHAAYQE